MLATGGTTPSRWSPWTAKDTPTGATASGKRDPHECPSWSSPSSGESDSSVADSSLGRSIAPNRQAQNPGGTRATKNIRANTSKRAIANPKRKSESWAESPVKVSRRAFGVKRGRSANEILALRSEESGHVRPQAAAGDTRRDDGPLVAQAPSVVTCQSTPPRPPSTLAGSARACRSAGSRSPRDRACCSPKPEAGTYAARRTCYMFRSIPSLG